MKKISTIVMALALVMALTQCKKNEGSVNSDNTSETVTIMLSVGGDSASKVSINPALGTVNFEEGDKIYVGSGGKYVGMLTHDGNHHFVGNITNPSEGQPLHFYFLGNVTPNEALGAGTTEECSVIISDQTGPLPVISYAPSNENYSWNNYSYTAHLLNKCALVKFNVTTPSTTPICIIGMNNKVTVNFANNTVTPSQDGEGVIMLSGSAGENVEKWAILLPQAALEEGDEGTLHSKYGDYLGTRPAIPAITNNGYLIEGINLTVNTTNYPEGATNGLFTINANGDQVYFSKGNLQYIGYDTPQYWKFADNQWIHYANFYNGNEYRHFFCWGTSGYNHGAVCYHPTSQSQTYEDYYAYGSYNYNLYDQTGQADWGYNAISNGGNQENSGWRTLTIEEWDYLLHTRNTESGIRWTQGKIYGYAGIILLPDNWDISIYGLNDPNGGNYNSNSITEEEWYDILEPNGAVFLPALGRRDWSVSYGSWYISDLDVNYKGFYWSSSTHSASSICCVMFYSGSSNFIDYMSRSTGCSVRLVKDYNP